MERERTKEEMRTTDSLERRGAYDQHHSDENRGKTTAGRTVKWKVTTAIQLKPQLGLSRFNDGKPLAVLLSLGHTINSLALFTDPKSSSGDEKEPEELYSS